MLDSNLRTYAGARKAIFGPTEHLLKSVNAAAKVNTGRDPHVGPLWLGFQGGQQISVEGLEYI